MSKKNVEIKNTYKRVFCVSDIHGGHKALVQVLERSGFDYENDTLIQLGDVCDGRTEVYECVEELLKIKNLIPIRGNHDEPFDEFCRTGIHSWGWSQGGNKTAISYLRKIGQEDMIQPKGTEGRFLTSLNPEDVPLTHHKFFRSQIAYYVDEQNRCFVHGGFNRHSNIKTQMPYTLWWDRDLFNAAMSYEAMTPVEGISTKFKMKDNFKEVFIGHTTTQCWNKIEYIKAANIYNLDCGAGGSGRLCMMNVNTKEVFYSDLMNDLYPNELGRW